MDPRRRVRQFLSGGDADRPPFLAMATDYTAKLAQCSAGELLADPVLFVRSFQESVAVLGLDAVVIEITAGQAAPAAAGGDPAGSTLPSCTRTCTGCGPRCSTGSPSWPCCPVPGRCASRSAQPPPPTRWTT